MCYTAHSKACMHRSSLEVLAVAASYYTAATCDCVLAQLLTLTPQCASLRQVAKGALTLRRATSRPFHLWKALYGKNKHLNNTFRIAFWPLYVWRRWAR
jgi:hypothetical protein